MYIFLIIIHVIVCLVLIAVVLLQAGRGGGISDMVGGGQPQSIFGTQTNTFMVRATEICAVIFILTSLSLGIISTQRGKSLMERRRFMENPIKASIPAAAPVAAAVEKTTAPASMPVAESPVSAAAASEVPASENKTS
jgi:preprotein translocase subunit SecG